MSRSPAPPVRSLPGKLIPARVRSSTALARSSRSERLLARRAVREAIVSLAGLVGGPIRNQAGEEIGRVRDVVARWSEDNPYPPITGIVARIGRRLAFVDIDAVAYLGHAAVDLGSARLDLRDFSRRDGEVLLGADVLDHQLVDVDGVQVIRAGDLLLAPAAGRWRLVGVDVSVRSLLRRLGPRRWRARPTPDRVIDWAGVQPFAGSDGVMRLRTSHDGLRRLRPGEVADLLEDLGREARQELLSALEPEVAADALEEMDPEELEVLLREASPDRAAELLASMEPDEAVDALRDLPAEERTALLGQMPSATASRLGDLLDFPEDRAGGFMTTLLVLASEGETVAEVVRRLRDVGEHSSDVDAVVLVDHAGRFVADEPLFDIAVADPAGSIGTLAEDTSPVTVGPDATVAEVAARLVDASRSSVVVVEDGRPIGRILADDVVDALTPDRGRLHFPRLLG